MRFGDRPIVVIAIVVSACGGGESTGTPPPPPPKRGIQIVSGANVTDTAGAILPQALVVDVHDSAGTLAGAGTLVRFEAVAGNRIGSPFEAFVQSLTAQVFEGVATEPTDASGRVGVMVRLGNFAGPARVVISVPTLRLADTARFTVLPGAASRVIVAPADTALYIGRTYRLRGGVSDQFGNPRGEPVTWSASGAGIAISSEGIVTAVAEGRYTITASSNRGTATGAVSVVPPGRIVAWQIGDSSQSLITAELDGSNRRTLAPVDGGEFGTQPSWIPGTNSVIYNSFSSALRLQILYVVDENGVVKPVFAQLPPNVSHQAEPSPSADGQWLYFSAFDTRCKFEFFCLHRSRMDGSALELLDPYVQGTAVSWHPAPSPDGSKLGFETFGVSGRKVIKALDVARQALLPWSVLGSYPRWSPTGTQIAYVQDGGGPVMLMNADGSNERALSEPGKRFFEEPLSWSSDGRWIIARTAASLNLIDVNAGTVLPLAFFTAMRAASLK